LALSKKYVYLVHGLIHLISNALVRSACKILFAKTLTFFAIRKASIIFLFFITYQLNAHPILKSKKRPNQFLRVAASPLVGFYSTNLKHASKPSQRMSAMLSVRHELKLDRSNKLFFLYGAEYLVHGMNYKSYYFKQDSLPLYTGKLNYSYSAYAHEARLPVQFRLSFRNEKNAVASPYVLLGYQLRYITFSKLQVAQNGNVVVNESVDMKFKNGLITSKINSGITLAFGFQKNPINTTVNPFVEVSWQYGFSPYYFQKPYAANNVNMNNSFLGLNVGLRF
jgi:hypothetical protein